MVLKFKLKTLDGLDENVKQLYKEVDGEFILDIEGDPDKGDGKSDDAKQKEIEAILSKNKELLDELKKNKTAKKELEDKRKADEEAKHLKDGNHEALLKSAQEKIAEKDSYIKEMIDKNNGQMLDTTVMAIAAKLCDGSNVSLIKPHIRNRLGVNDKGELQILNPSGEPTVSTREDLISEIQSNKDFAPLLRGTGSSGGGASGGSSGGASIPNFDKMSPMERLIHARENPELDKQ